MIDFRSLLTQGLWSCKTLVAVGLQWVINQWKGLLWAFSIALVCLGALRWTKGLVAVAVISGVGYLLTLALLASRHIEESPKCEMFVCDTHGPLPVGATLTLFEDMEYHQPNGQVKRGPIRGCPLCFETQVKRAVGRK